MLITDFTYQLPDDRIAKFPLDERDKSKLLLFRNGSITTDVFSQLPDYFSKKDMLVFNNTRVIRARIEMEKETGARIEIFCLEPHEPSDYQMSFSQRATCQWKCLVGNLKKWKTGTLIKNINPSPTLPEGEGVKAQCIAPLQLHAELISTNTQYQIIRFTWDNGLDFASVLEACGSTPIPPYLNRKTEEIDETRYQTVYSKHKGSVAAPTAGLHFTPQVLQQLSANGTQLNEITLHVGAGTFRPVKHEEVKKHDMHVEFFSVHLDVIRNLARRGDPCGRPANKGFLTAVGTTSLRALESIYWIGVKMLEKPLPNCGSWVLENIHLEQWEAYALPQNVTVEQSLNKIIETLEKNNQNTLFASTKIMIVPGYTFKMCSRLITNFHQPQSSLLLLVGAFVGDSWRDIYQYALENDFRFLSYGDSSLLSIKN